MYKAAEAGLKGGVCHALRRHVKAETGIALGYFDATSMYPSVMCDYLPCGEWEWDDEAAWSAARIMVMKADDERDASFTATLRVPPEIHGHFRNFPPPPEHDKGASGDRDGKLCAT